MFTIKDVITDALSRANLVNRRQEAPGHMVESAYLLLRGIAADYSSHNLLQFLRREVDLNETVIKEDQVILSDDYTMGENFWLIEGDDITPYVEDGTIPEAENVPDGAKVWNRDRSVWVKFRPDSGAVLWRRDDYPSKERAIGAMNGAVTKVIPGGIQPVMVIGTIDPDIHSDVVQVPVENLEKITEVYWDRSNDPMANATVPLQFVSFEDFNNGAYGEYIYTWQPISDTKVELKLKPRFVRMLTNSQNLKMIYNVRYSFDLNSVMKIPDIYQELFTVALTYKLAVKYPRLSPEHTERLRVTLKEIEDSVKTPTRANKLIIREPAACNTLCRQYQLESGSFIFPR